MENLEKKQKSISVKKGRIMKGVVVSDKMNKTIVVAIDSLKAHPKYKKRYKSTKHYKAHDENNEYKVGDKVFIQECRPISKGKKWIVNGIIKNVAVNRADTEREK